MAFTFKQFHINDDDCGMPVSTDGVLLGAFAPLAQAKTVLDIGAGSGLLSLMAAQRTGMDCQITAVELDPSAAQACAINAANSPWSKRITVANHAIQDFCLHTRPLSFEHIICNPPYFEQGALAQDATRASARHTHNLSFEELFSAISLLLALDGLCTLILPVLGINSATKALTLAGLRISTQRSVVSVEGKPVSRVLLVLSHGNEQAATQQAQVQPPLYIRDKQGQFSPEMADLCQHFYLKL